jgi:hypothetical protein
VSSAVNMLMPFQSTVGVATEIKKGKLRKENVSLYKDKLIIKKCQDKKLYVMISTPEHRVVTVRRVV